jgi:hypothetical protein
MQHRPAVGVHRSWISWLVIGAIALILIVALTIAIDPHGWLNFTSAASAAQPTAAITSGAGITPHLNLNATGPNVVRYTTADAEAFIKRSLSHGTLDGTIKAHGPYTFTEAAFMTAQAANALLNNNLGILLNETVCVVGIRGDFTVYADTYTYAFEVFDGKTGNVLLTGARNQPV